MSFGRKNKAEKANKQLYTIVIPIIVIPIIVIPIIVIPITE